MKHQQRVNEYHEEIARHGHDMHIFHATWHQQNQDPNIPSRPDRNWGVNNTFGQKFLQMHHEMVKAGDDEPKTFMRHKSIASWYQSKNYDLPAPWNPASPIPDELNHFPKPDTTFVNGQSVSLKRTTNTPAFQLPKWFTVSGVSDGERGEPLTGARKLADFINLNQLGNCIVFPHNVWHGTIGGSMSFFDTAINDPIFYFGVHWHIENVFDAYLNIVRQSEPRLSALEEIKSFSLKQEDQPDVPQEFTRQETDFLKLAIDFGKILRR